MPAIFEDMVYFTAPDGYVVAVDARTGKLRWETKAFELETKTEHSGGLIVADGKVISNRTCVTRTGCFIAAHDARTGKELWKFYNTAGAGEPGGDTWGGIDTEKRVASSWGLPGSYDPTRRVLYWAISNPIPYTRLKRHDGNAAAVPNFSPSELYSNSTLALDIDTGKLVWYYQHLPGDDWDSDHIHERTLIRTKVSPDPKFVKWINPKIAKGEERDIVIDVAEAGDVFALDRQTGQFLWATPFPYDVPNLNMKAIDVETGRTQINDALMFKKDGDRAVGCFQNTRSYWATSYDPKNNSLYVPFQDACLDMTADSSKPLGYGPRFGVRRAGVAEDKFMGMMKIDMATGEMKRIFSQAAPGNGSALTTAGDLLFWGDLNRRFRAFDPDTGKVLWEVDRRRHGDDLDHHLRGRRQAICRHLHRRRPVRHPQPDRHGAQHQSRARQQRGLRVHVAEQLTAFSGKAGIRFPVRKCEGAELVTSPDNASVWSVGLRSHGPRARARA